MKSIYKSLLVCAGICALFAGCQKWTDTKIKEPLDLTTIDKTEAYYQALRDYKLNDKHSVAFGWFGNWTGTGTSMENSLMGLPDSVDFVSLWGNWANPGEDRIADFKKVKELKGTRALVCFLVFDIGDQITPAMPENYPGSEEAGFNWKHEYWGWGTSLEEHIAATEKYARAILDTIAKYDYDGFDLDAEPSYAQPFPTDKELWRGGREIMETFVRTLATELGPKAGKGKLLVIDGEPEAMAKEFCDYFDYFIIQAYGSYNDASLDSRYTTQLNHWLKKDGDEVGLTPEEIANKLIVCENFEAYAQNGGVNYTRGNGATTRSLDGFAHWNPTYNGETLRKGGIGTYHMEYEYKVGGYDATYPYMRHAIQVMNPRID